MATDLILATDRDIQLVKKTVAQDLHPAELDLFVHMCRRWRLDPLRRQIYAIVYNKDRPEKRRVSYVTGIDGYRTIADRTKCYRPGQRSVETSDAAKNQATNPQGIVSATASVWKHVHGEWHEFSETVYWDEYAPLREVWEYDKTEGKKKPSGRFELDRSGQWGKMGRVLLQKCAEAQALRRGWPDEYGDLYVTEEMDQAKVIDITPSEQAERAEATERQTKLGGPCVIIDWLDSKPLASVPADKLHGLVRDFVRINAEEPSAILAFADRNRDALRQFWSMKPDEALDLKKCFETYQNVQQAAE